MKLVKQLDDTGCGIACLAMLSKRGYKHVKKIAIDYGFLSNPKSGKYNTTTKNLRAIADKLEGVSVVSSRRKKFNGVDQLPKYSILSVPFDHTKTEWHWVVSYKKDNSIVVYDPEGEAKEYSEGNIERVGATHYLSVDVGSNLRNRRN